MTISRRDAVRVSGTAMAGLALGLGADTLLAQAPQAPAAVPPPAPDTIVDATVRTIAPLPLNADGSAPEHPPAAAGPITEPYMWRYTKGQPPAGEYDYRKLKIKVDARGMARRTGTLAFADLEKLPRVSMVTLLQCGTPTPSGVVKWGGVRFSDFAQMIGLSREGHYVRFIAVDRHYVDEPVEVLMRPQVMLAWMMNDQPIPADHGAPLRLIIPFRYGNRHIKSITDIMVGTPALPPWAG